jgi:hypothetical protein
MGWLGLIQTYAASGTFIQTYAAYVPFLRLSSDPQNKNSPPVPILSKEISLCTVRFYIHISEYRITYYCSPECPPEVHVLKTLSSSWRWLKVVDT